MKVVKVFWLNPRVPPNKPHRQIKSLLSSRRMPEKGWDDATIEMLIQVGGQGCGWRPDCNQACKGHSCLDGCSYGLQSPALMASHCF